VSCKKPDFAKIRNLSQTKGEFNESETSVFGDGCVAGGEWDGDDFRDISFFSEGARRRREKRSENRQLHVRSRRDYGCEGHDRELG
jgi:hypothetical protein